MVDKRAARTEPFDDLALLSRTLQARMHNVREAPVDDVWCAYYDVSELAEGELMTRAQAMLPWPERRQKAERFVFNKDRRLCVGAGLLAASMLRAQGATDLTLAYGSNEKPRLANHPNLHFNISHSGTYATCAVSPSPVGVDIEVVCDHGRAVAEHCFVSGELSWLNAQADTARAFTSLWVRKESYIKLLGTGLSRDPLSFAVIGDDELSVADEVAFVEFEVGDCLACVCTTTQQPVRLSRWQSALSELA